MYPETDCQFNVRVARTTVKLWRNWPRLFLDFLRFSQDRLCQVCKCARGIRINNSSGRSSIHLYDGTLSFDDELPADYCLLTQLKTNNLCLVLHHAYVLGSNCCETYEGGVNIVGTRRNIEDVVVLVSVGHASHQGAGENNIDARKPMIGARFQNPSRNLASRAGGGGPTNYLSLRHQSLVKV